QLAQIPKLLPMEQSPEVLVQLAIAAPKLGGDPIPMLLAILAKSETDPSGLLPRICWRNLEPHLDGRVAAMVHQLKDVKIPESVLNEIMPRVLDRCRAKQKEQPADLMAMLGYVLNGSNRKLSATALAAVTAAELNGETSPE